MSDAGQKIIYSMVRVAKTHRSTGKQVRRPLSPHLQVYRLPLTARLSILHRITGVGLAVGALVLVWWLVAAATSDGAYATVSAVLRSPIGYLALFAWSVAIWPARAAATCSCWLGRRC